MSIEKISKIVSDFETQLSEKISVGATSFKITSATDNDGSVLSDGLYAFTINRDNTSAKQYLIGQLTASTKTISSIFSIDRQGNLTSGAVKEARLGSNVIISDHSILVSVSRILRGEGKLDPATPLAYDTDPTLSSSTELATKGYVDSVVTGGTINADKIIIGSQIAGETVAAGNIVYFKSSDSRWWKADADLTATFQNVMLGVALGAGTAGNAIANGVQIFGKCTAFTGLTATATYYLSNTAGGVSSSAGTNSIILGQAFSTTGIFFNPGYPNLPTSFVSTSAGTDDANKGAVLNAYGKIDNSMNTAFGGDGSDNDLNVTSGTTNLSFANANVLIKNYKSLNISAGATLGFTNPATDGSIAVLRVQGNVTIAGTIDLRLMGAVGSTSNGGDGTSAFNLITVSNTPKGKGGSAGNGSGSGGAGGVQDLKPLFSSSNTYVNKIFISCGSGGGHGYGSTSGAGGRGGGGIIIECNGTFTFTGTINTSGQDATASSVDGGGSGGGSAGMALVRYKTLGTNTGTFTATGGAGSLGYGIGSSNAGGGGAGSVVGDGGNGSATSGANGGNGGVGAGGGGTKFATGSGGTGGSTLSLILEKV